MWSLLALLTKTVLNFLTSFLSPHAFWIHCASFCSFKSTTTSSLATWSFMSCRPETLSRGTTMATLTHLLKFISFQGEGESKGVETASTPGLSSSGQEKEGQCRINGSQSEKCCSCASVAVVIKGLSQPLLEREFECYTCIDIPNLKRQQLCKTQTGFPFILKYNLFWLAMTSFSVQYMAFLWHNFIAPTAQVHQMVYVVPVAQCDMASLSRNSSAPYHCWTT